MRYLMFKSLLMVILFSAKAGFGIEAGTEHLLGILSSDEGIMFQVQSGGCTAKENFEVLVSKEGEIQIELQRLRPDFCRAYIPHGVVLFFGYKEILGDMALTNPFSHSSIKVTNPFGSLLLPQNPD